MKLKLALLTGLLLTATHAAGLPDDASDSTVTDGEAGVLVGNPVTHPKVLEFRARKRAAKAAKEAAQAAAAEAEAKKIASIPLHVQRMLDWEALIASLPQKEKDRLAAAAKAEADRKKEKRAAPKKARDAAFLEAQAAALAEQQD